MAPRRRHFPARRHAISCESSRQFRRRPALRWAWATSSRSRRHRRERLRAQPRDLGRPRRAPRSTSISHSPYTYLAAERVDRLFAGLQLAPGVRRGAVRRRAAWPTTSVARQPRAPSAAPAAGLARRRTARRARSDARRGAGRERGRGAAFVLAASRLAFCGGFDVDDSRDAGRGGGRRRPRLRRLPAAPRATPRRDGAMRRRRPAPARHGRRPPARAAASAGCCSAGEERLPEAAAAARAGLGNPVIISPCSGRCASSGGSWAGAIPA